LGIRFPGRDAFFQNEITRTFSAACTPFVGDAQNCNDLQIAHRLRVIAADYFAAAHVGNKPAQRQQQVQSDKEDPR
jgi:hypothetical protein